MFILLPSLLPLFISLAHINNFCLWMNESTQKLSLVGTTAFVPAELPARYNIAFVPASTSVPVTVSVPTSTYVSVPVSAPATPAVPVISSAAPSTDYSAISSVNFAIPVSSPSCIGQTQ